MPAAPVTPVSDAHVAPPGGVLTRNDILAAAQDADGPWRFVPLAEAAVAAYPHDHDMRYLLAVTYARMGLRTPAAEHLAKLSAALPGQSEVRALVEAVRRLPNDRVPAERLIATATGNAAALAERGVDVLGLCGAWRDSLTTRQFVIARTAGGEETLVRAAAATGWVWQTWGPMRAQAERLGRELAPAGHGVGGDKGASATGNAAGVQRPVVIEGVCPPWTLMVIARALPSAADGASAGLRVLQVDAMELLDGLAMADLRALILDERTWFFVGERGPEALERWLDARDTTLIDGVSVVAPGVRVRSSRTPAAILSGAVERQAEQIRVVGARVAARGEVRDRPWWARRFAAAWPRDGSPGSVPASQRLRVLVPTYRMSTYLRHAAGDLCDALRTLGVDARLLMEPDCASPLTRLAHIRAADEFDPDVIVSPNYTRAGLNGVETGDAPAIHARVPFVTWVQDAMAHLFRASSGRAMSELDFAVGHAHLDLFTEFQYPRERFLPFSIAVSPRKFHAAAVSVEERARLECEIAVVTHHSETPAQMVERVARESEGVPGLARLVRAAFPVAEHLADDPLNRVNIAGVNEHARRLLEEHRVPLSAENRALLANQILRPLVDRVLRHRTLEWAADLCERRGWRLRVYGRGWEKHPRLGMFARGVLDHGDDLRAAYQCAGVTLHVSAAANLHQRVMECALSGGLPVALFKLDDLDVLRAAAMVEASRSCQAWCCSVANRERCVCPADHPAVAMVADVQDRLPVRDKHFVYFHEYFKDALHEHGCVAGLDWRAAWLMGDPEATCFWDRASFERTVSSAVESRDFRDRLSGAIAERVRRDFTIDTLARRMLDMIRDRLAAG